jgi:cytochrome c peroxidase
MQRKQWMTILGIVLTTYACQKAVSSLAVRFEQPVNFPAPVYHFDTNPVTTAGFELGRKLFNEPRLSRNNTITCSFCHIQSAAFTHHGHDVSHGIDDRLGSRNSPPIMNLAWSPTVMWDGGVFDLDLQPIAPITNFVEMDENMDTVLNRLRNTPVYPPLFKKAFGTAEITSVRFLKALSQFMVMCISADSRYDSVQRKQAVFTTDEAQGYVLFQQKCNTCHKEPLFTDHSFRDNGIGIGPNDDQGRFLVTLNPGDKYRFKVPSLRNLGYTAPYMHDGRFYSLDAVLENYRNGIHQTPNLDPVLQQNGRLGIDMTDEEKRKIIVFLQTLNDKTFVTNKLFAEP